MKRPLIVVGLPILVSLLVFGCRTQFGPDPLGRAREQVAIGDSREKAIEVLSSEAWYYQPCDMTEEAASDLFFFGSHSYDRASIVIVDSIREDGEYRVDMISSFESYAWHTAYANCVDRKRFED